MERGISRHVKPLAAKIKETFDDIARNVATRLISRLGLTHKADAAEIETALALSLTDADFILLQQLLTPELERQFAQSGYSLVTALKLIDDESITDHLDENAKAYAKARAAELVGKQIEDDGTIVDNPDPAWSITDSTRDILRSTVEDAVTEGWSAEKLAGEISDSFAFSDSRSETIARTELAFAHTAGHMDVGKETGAIGKRSILGSEHDSDVPDGDECDDAEDAGVIGIDDDFVPGYDTPPYHPNCVCDFVLVYPGDEDADELENDE